MENDCAPGDETFKQDIINRLPDMPGYDMTLDDAITPPVICIIPDNINVPQVVLDAAIAWVWSDYEVHIQGLIEKGAEFGNWRLDYLEHAYTYDDLKIEVYRFQWRIHTTTPDFVRNILVGGMDLDEDGWFLNTYPDSWYLLFESSSNDLKFLSSIMENDCVPGDETFTQDIINWVLKTAGTR
jgi:hypothetical protein